MSSSIESINIILSDHPFDTPDTVGLKVQARHELQALLDDRNFWRQTATDMEQSVRSSMTSLDEVAYMLMAAIRNFNDAVDARAGDKQ